MSMISELVKELRNEAQEVRLCSNECESAELLDRAADTIEMLSEKVRADRPQGEWIDMGDFEQCSVCKGTHLKEFQSYYGETTWIKTPYCPSCGARMIAKDTNVPNKEGVDNE